MFCWLVPPPGVAAERYRLSSRLRSTLDQGERKTKMRKMIVVRRTTRMRRMRRTPMRMRKTTRRAPDRYTRTSSQAGNHHRLMNRWDRTLHRQRTRGLHDARDLSAWCRRQGSGDRWWFHSQLFVLQGQCNRWQCCRRRTLTWRLRLTAGVLTLQLSQVGPLHCYPVRRGRWRHENSISGLPPLESVNSGS